MSEFNIIMRDLTEQHDDIEVKWDVCDNHAGREWFAALRYNFIGPDAICPNHPLEKTHCLNGWVDTVENTNNPGLRDIPTMCSELNWAIERVNDFYKDKGYPHIDLHFSPEALQGDQYRDLMNQLHHHFELLIGQVWNVSDWFKMANHETIYAIRILNNNCHQIENVINSLDSEHDEKTRHQSIMISFNGINFTNPDHEKKSMVRFNVSDKAYDCWSAAYEWGNLYAFYCQLGKRHIEAWMDDDPHIDHDNISGIRFFTGEATMNLCTMFPPGSGLPAAQRPKFIEWLVKHGFDPNDKKNAYGHGCVARIRVPEEFNGDYRQYHNEIKKRNDVWHMGWKHKGVSCGRHFDYTWKDQVTGEIHLSKQIDEVQSNVAT